MRTPACTRKLPHCKTEVDKTTEEAMLANSEKDGNRSQAVSYIESIQSKLKNINTYLSKRGLHSIGFQNREPEQQ
jgi:hypothetical protein